jgi:hypothetical protein
VRLLIALSLLAGLIVPGSNALAAGSGGIGIRLADIPWDSRDDPLTGPYIVDRLAPGATVRRRVEISNSTRSTATVAVYPAAAALPQGRFAFAEGRTRNELSSWTAVNRKVVSVPPGTRLFKTLTIAVPKTASLGERYAVLWAEVSAPAAATGGVTLVNRVGVRMYISVGPGGGQPSNFAIGSLSAERSETGAPLVVAVVHNTGGQTLDIAGDLILSDGPGGLRAGPFAVELESALTPSSSESATVRLDTRLPRGPWRAEIRLRSGLVQRTAERTITFPVIVGAAKPAPADGGAETGPMIVAGVFGILALLALALAVWLIRRAPRGRGGGVGPAVPIRS